MATTRSKKSGDIKPVEKKQVEAPKAKEVKEAPKPVEKKQVEAPKAKEAPASVEKKAEAPATKKTLKSQDDIEVGSKILSPDGELSLVVRIISDPDHPNPRPNEKLVLETIKDKKIVKVRRRSAKLQ